MALEGVGDLLTALVEVEESSIALVEVEESSIALVEVGVQGVVKRILAVAGAGAGEEFRFEKV